MRRVDPPAVYQYRVRSRDPQGNVSPWSAITPLRPSIVQEKGAVSYSGTWRKVPDTNASGGWIARSSAPGSTASFSFSGKSIALAMPTRSTLGTAKVCLDPGTTHQICRTVDLSPSTGSLAPRRLVFARDGLSAVTHRLRVTVASGTVDLDAFAVLR